MPRTSLPKSAFVAISIKLYPVTLETKGKLREARTFTSITMSLLSFARNWILKGPVILSARTIRFVMSRARRTVSKYVRWGGKTTVASPECVPAFSTCSVMAYKANSPLIATPSISISRAFSINFDKTSGCSAEIAIARSRNFFKKISSGAIAMADPDKT